MAYIPGTISTQVYNFIKSANSKEVTNTDQATLEFAEMLEKTILAAIQQMDVVVPPGTIVVATNTGAGSNPTPLLIPQPLK